MKKNKSGLTHRFSRSFFVDFASWTPESAKFAGKFEIYAKKKRRKNKKTRTGFSGLESKIQDQKWSNLFLKLFFVNPVMGLVDATVGGRNIARTKSGQAMTR